MTKSPFVDPEGARRWVEEYEARQPHAEVDPVGRWSWAVRVVDGILVTGPWIVRGSRARADRFAARRLADHFRAEDRSREAHRVLIPRPPSRPR